MRQHIENSISAGRTREALSRIDELLEREADTSWLWRKKSQCLFMLGRLPEAIQAGEAAVDTARTSGDGLAEAEAENALGIIRGELGDLEKTIQHLERSYDLHKALGTNRVAAVLNNMGNTCLIMNDPGRARTYFEKSLQTAGQSDDLREVEGTARANLGRACLALGEVPEAIEHFNISIEHFRQHGMEPLRLHAITKLAAALEAGGDLAAAEACYQEALAATVGEDEPAAWQHEIHGSLATLLVRQNRFDEAEPHFLQAFRLTEAAESNFNVPYWRKHYSSVLEHDEDMAGALRTMRTAFDELDQTTERKIETQLFQAMGRFEVERIEHEKELYRVRNEELAAALAEVEQLRDALEEQNRQLSELVIRDPLTAAFNRRWFFSQLDTEIDRSRRHARPVSVVVLDLDHFKLVNDSHGHAVGDQILVAASTILMRSTRKTDDVARYGGEEFAIIMPDTRLAQAQTVCEKLLGLFQSHDWDALGGVQRVTFSAGVAEIDELSPDSGSPAKDLIELADLRLYEAKARGRNCVVGA